ncbi:MAG: MarR family winged helix-turn-helix transcriptional regulator [Dysgonomonas sp.]|uniref:HTH marR-type domain-containing protein n=1 Tax=uncultured Dysgonomonas sp. TaxID=206096 RepID=A0A212JNL6_9BACT|nr:MarR family winged helix-turn-helix transcriptional regulator [uncultured Dysgonomonas sp.]MDU1890966.1 MarR family winged helix-turn-helix transcriptional regulator [Dysgonomonas sp.]SBW01019.1 conserved hypothetical protein [uncultured Dysgonomonas sp.]
MYESNIVAIDHLFNQVIKLWTKRKKQVLDNCGLTHSQFEILSAIYHFTVSRQEIIQIDLSEKTGIDPMTTSTILRNLEKKQFVTRMRGTENTRVVYIKLTAEGIDVYKCAFSSISEMNNSLYCRVNRNNLVKQLRLLSDELCKINN